MLSACVTGRNVRHNVAWCLERQGEVWRNCNMCSSVCDIIATGGGLPCNARGILEMKNRVLTEKAGAFLVGLV